MITKTWKIPGLLGQQNEASFFKSVNWEFGQDGEKVLFCAECADITGTNDYVIVKITAPTDSLCDKVLNGQISDGFFENCSCGAEQLESITADDESEINFDNYSSNPYAYNDILALCKGLRTDKAINCLGKWAENFGDSLWNGEYYRISELDERLSPIYSFPEQEDADVEIIGYEFL